MADETSPFPFSARLRVALMAAGLGLVLLYGVGFASWSTLHAVTGVARQALGFPGL